MEKEIENIWKKGFEQERVGLDQEQIITIRKGKSKNLVMKIRETMWADHFALLVVAVLLAGIFAYMEYYGFAIYLLVALGALFIQNTFLLRRVEKVKLKDSTLDYLLKFRSVINYLQKYTRRLLVIGLPLLITPSFLYGLRMAGVSWEQYFFAGNQVKHFAILILVVALLTMAGLLAYPLSVRLLYGKKLQRLDEMIADLQDETVD